LQVGVTVTGQADHDGDQYGDDDQASVTVMTRPKAVHACTTGGYVRAESAGSEISAMTQNQRGALSVDTQG
jgi:hypothetical protein